MGAKIITFDGKQVSSKHDAIQWDLIHGKNGIISGCELTYVSTNKVHMNAGYMIIKGHLIEFTEADIACELSSSGTMLGRIYIRMDLSDINTPSLSSIARASLPALVQNEACNYSNGIYEEELATYTAATTVISNLVSTGKHLYGPRAEILDTMADIKANTYANRFMGALAGKELNESLLLQQVRTSTERIIGKWTDGKTLYEKTYSWIPNALGTTMLATGIANLKKMWVNSADSYVIYGGTYRTSTWIGGVPAEGSALSCGSGNIFVYIGTSLALASVTEVCATVRYTKNE